jgi:DNA invertase Pin-like site-specific DNA recombinase
VKPLIPYLRQSKAKEQTISIEDQRRAIHSWAAGHPDVTLAPEVVEQNVSGKKAWRSRELGEAITRIERGEAGGLIVAWQDRLSREDNLATAEVWQALDNAGARFVAAGEGLDTATGDHELLYTIKAAVARENWKRIRTYNNNGRRSMVERGVHGGNAAPLGYDGTKDGKLRGPLTPNTDAPRIPAAFEAMDNGGSWRDIIAILGVKSQSAATSILRNRVYLGEARSGEFVKPDTHPPLVDEALFNRVQRRLDDRARARRDHPTETVPVPRKPNVLAGVMRCAHCAHSMSPTGSGSYRCQYKGDDAAALHPEGQPYISAKSVLPVVLEMAKGWHAVHSPLYMLEREMDEAMLPALAEAEDEAERVLGEVEANRAVWDAVTYGNARADAVRRIEAARDARQEAEAAQGWLGIDAERVEERLAEGDPATVNDFLRDTIRVMVYPSPYGKRRKCPVEERIKVQYLSAGRGLDPAVVYAPPVEGGPVAPRPEDYIESEAVPDQFPEAGVMDDAEAARRLAELTDPHPVEVPDRW